MHHHLEIIMPPTDNIELAISQIMAPFDEQIDPEEYDKGNESFWDWYVIGGRWAGTKLIETLGKEKLDAFGNELEGLKLTVSSITAGKQELQPPEQAEIVDALWVKHFPDSGINICPMFKHYSNQYGEVTFMDICTYKELPPDLMASRVIIAGPNWEGKLEALRMWADSTWNGVSFQDTKWDGKVSSVIEEHAKMTEHAREDYKEKITIREDWLCVTVDYHS